MCHMVLSILCNLLKHKHFFMLKLVQEELYYIESGAYFFAHEIAFTNSHADLIDVPSDVLTFN
jgi:hypothetical protein